jgi:predicted glycoside hydrolase/deacetylase ChbG (UPF0249 family)
VKRASCDASCQNFGLNLHSRRLESCHASLREGLKIRIIINSDDLGMNPFVNEEILNLLSEKRITSVTAIANAPSIEEVIPRLPERWDYSVGVHLNLTEFSPLTPPSQIGPLAECLNDKGCFAGEERLRAVSVTSLLREAFFRELCLQVDKIRSMGVRISHLDSHNHIHTIPSLFPVLKRVQRCFDIRRVRMTRNIYSPRSCPSAKVLLEKRLWSCALRCYYRTVTTSGFGSLNDFCDLAKLKQIRYESVEVMVHPGHPQYQHETKLLHSDWWRELPFMIELINYHDL